MDKEKLEAQIIDYIDGQLNSEDRAVLEKELKENPEARHLYEQLCEVIDAINRSENFEPGPGLKKGFEKMLKEESDKPSSTRTIFFQPVFYRAAAALLLVASGIGIGYWINKSQQREAEILALKEEVAETKQKIGRASCRERVCLAV